MYPYFVIEFLLHKCEKNLNSRFLRVRYLLVFVYLIMFYSGKKKIIYVTGIIGHTFSLGEYILIDIYRWIIGGVGSIFVLVIELLLQFVKNSRNKVVNVVELMGKNFCKCIVCSFCFE